MKEGKKITSDKISKENQRYIKPKSRQNQKEITYTPLKCQCQFWTLRQKQNFTILRKSKVVFCLISFIKHDVLSDKMSWSHSTISSIVSLYSNYSFFCLVSYKNKNNGRIVVKYYNNLLKIINS